MVHEIKKTDCHEEAHEWQVKYYIYVLERNGITGVTGVLEYPRLHETNEVVLTLDDGERIQTIEKEIAGIIQSEICPKPLQKKMCKNCSYFDFCWSGEDV